MSQQKNFSTVESIVESPKTQRFTEDPNWVLYHPENAPLLSALQQMSSTLEKYGYSVPPYSSHSLFKLASQTQERKNELTQIFELWNQWIQPESSSETTPCPTNSKKERAFAEKALTYYKLNVDEKFWTKLEDDNVIEIYGKDMIQLYRSLNFFKYCGYSLLDISINEWYILWNRPSQIIRLMEQEVAHVLKNNLGVYKSNVPRHLLTETLNTGETQSFVPRASVVDFQYLGALWKGSPMIPEGFICTAAGSVLMKGDITLEIGFI